MGMVQNILLLFIFPTAATEIIGHYNDQYEMFYNFVTLRKIFLVFVSFCELLCDWWKSHKLIIYS